MTERLLKRVLCLIFALCLVHAAGADYTGSTIGVRESGSVTGDVRIEYGTSSYSGELAPGASHGVTFPVSVPPSATIRTALLYVFWTWSHDGTEGVAPSVQTRAGGASLSPLRSYTDRKGSGLYDYPSGTIVYNVAGRARPNSPLSVTVTNGASSAGFAVSGAVLLVAYDGGSNGVRYWVAEGADMIYATGDVTPTAATTRVSFSGIPAVAPGTAADLVSVVPSGNKGANTLSFNGRTFAGLFAGRPYPDLAVVTTPVGPLLKAGQNTVTLRDEGDYMVPGLFLLRVAGGQTTSTPAVTATLTPTVTPTGTTAASPTVTSPAPATTARTTTTPTITMTTIADTTTMTTVPTGTVTWATTVPTITVAPSTSLTTMPAETTPTGPTPPDEQNQTVVGDTTPVVITAPPTVAPNGTPDTPVVITPATTVPVATVTTQDPWTEPTTEPTTVATTTTTTATTVTTTATTVATVAPPPVVDDHVVLHAPTAAAYREPGTADSSNASAAIAGGDGQDPLGSLLPGGTDLFGLGIVLFGAITGAGIIVSAAITGAGIASYIARPERGGGRRAERPDRRGSSPRQQPETTVPPRRFDDDR
ncbi:MAG TPA: DUF3344 domain-containing protein [Methanoregulaceae archaeon]|nr:DUF3344 domain-containing protein [Methanoregulaceae archaeon]